MNLKEVQKTVYTEYQKNGFEEMWEGKDNICPHCNTLVPLTERQKKINDLGETGLFTTEVSEAMEEIRNKVFDENALGKECADVIIRTLNFMSRKGLDAEHYILKKNGINLNREKQHGRGV